MYKNELIQAVAIKAGVDCKTTAKVINATLEVISDELFIGRKVTLPNFGTFHVRGKAARTGRNPRTGEEIQIPAHKYLHFKPGKNFKGAVNQ